jgi:3,4-dihydroxy 2-butanone 4-phosphate synthase/GTP cyclohydrolase II
MVEGGVALLSSLMRQRLINYMVVTVAPVFAGGLRPGPTMATGAHPPAAAIDHHPAVSIRATPALTRVRTFTVGDDVVIAGPCEPARGERSRL